MKQYIKLPIDDVRRSYSILASDAAEAWKGSLDLAASVTAAQAEDEKESGSGSQNAGKVVKVGPERCVSVVAYLSEIGRDCQ